MLDTQDSNQSGSDIGLLEDWISRHDLAISLGVSEDTLWRWDMRRTGPQSIKLGRKVDYRRSTVRTRAFVEWEDWPRSVVIAAQRAGYFAPAPIWDDLRSFDARPFCGAFDIILAGYPCQPFSAAGKCAGADDPRRLWLDVARVVGECAPEWVFLENVPGHVTSHFTTKIHLRVNGEVLIRHWSEDNAERPAHENRDNRWPDFRLPRVRPGHGRQPARAECATR